jgi:RNA polymerase sigma-70 factor (ECF subfamily)
MPELLKPDFETVFEVYYDRVYKYAYTILLNRENAEDVVEETFLAAYVAYPGYDPARSSLATWLTRIAHNKAVNLVRSAAYRRETAMPEGLADRSPSVQDEPRYTVLWLYARLTQEEREFLDLRYAMELSDKEITALYGLEPKAVNKRFQRLLKRCRQLLDGGEEKNLKIV